MASYNARSVRSVVEHLADGDALGASEEAGEARPADREGDRHPERRERRAYFVRNVKRGSATWRCRQPATDGARDRNGERLLPEPGSGIVRQLGASNLHSGGNVAQALWNGLLVGTLRAWASPHFAWLRRPVLAKSRRARATAELLSVLIGENGREP